MNIKPKDIRVDLPVVFTFDDYHDIPEFASTINTLRVKLNKCRDLLFGRTIVTNNHFSDYDRLYDHEPMYLDPPYYKAGNSLYIEKMTEADHFDLAVLLYKRKNWVLSYDDCSEIQDLYKDHEIIDLSARYCINGKKDSWKSKNELIILPY